MKKRYLVPEYISNIIFLKINYIIGVIGALICFLHTILQLQLAADLPKSSSHYLLNLSIVKYLSWWKRALADTADDDSNLQRSEPRLPA